MDLLHGAKEEGHFDLWLFSALAGVLDEGLIPRVPSAQIAEVSTGFSTSLVLPVGAPTSLVPPCGAPTSPVLPRGCSRITDAPAWVLPQH